MDVVSHGLWAGAAAAWLGRHRRLDRPMVAATVALGVAPDLLQFLPVIAWGATQPEPLAFLHSHIAAMPGAEPPMPDATHAWSHHLHCAMHSVVVAGLATALFAWRLRRWLPALAGWWLHIALDVPTHSLDYYPVPLFYPLTYWGVDGVDWTTPWVLALNYVALAAALLYLWRARLK